MLSDQHAYASADTYTASKHAPQLNQEHNQTKSKNKMF
jgi:hypothetical protein